MLVSLVPLSLLALALLGELGREDLWRRDLAPAVEGRVTAAVFNGVDYTVERIFSESAWPLILLASALALWHVARGMRIVMKALNAVHGTSERRGWRELLVVDVALALVVYAAFTGAVLLVVFLPRLADAGAASLALQVAAWAGAAGLFGVAFALLIRYAPAERPELRWASAGSLLVVSTWVATTLVFAWWTGSVASYKSAVGTLAAFLVLTTYVLVSTTIFLVGAQVDELLRRNAR